MWCYTSWPAFPTHLHPLPPMVSGRPTQATSLIYRSSTTIPCPRPSHTLPHMVSGGPSQAPSLNHCSPTHISSPTPWHTLPAWFQGDPLKQPLSSTAAQLTSPPPDPATLWCPWFRGDPVKQPLSSTAAQLTSPAPDPATLCRTWFRVDPVKHLLSITAAQLTSPPPPSPPLSPTPWHTLPPGFQGTQLSNCSHLLQPDSRPLLHPPGPGCPSTWPSPPFWGLPPCPSSLSPPASWCLQSMPQASRHRLGQQSHELSHQSCRCRLCTTIELHSWPGCHCLMPLLDIILKLCCQQHSMKFNVLALIGRHGKNSAVSCCKQSRMGQHVPPARRSHVCLCAVRQQSHRRQQT